MATMHKGDDDDDDNDNNNNNNNNNNPANMELGRFLTRSGLTCSEVSSLVSPGFYCLLVRSCLLHVFSVIYQGALCLYVATSFFCIPVFFPKLGVYLFFNLFLLKSVQM